MKCRFRDIYFSFCYAGKYRKVINGRSEQKQFENEIINVQDKIFDSSSSGELGKLFYNNMSEFQ